MSKPALLEGEALGKRGASTFSDRFASVANTRACYSVHGAGQTNALHPSHQILPMLLSPTPWFCLFLAVSKVKFGHHGCRYELATPWVWILVGFCCFACMPNLAQCFHSHPFHHSDSMVLLCFYFYIGGFEGAVWAPCLQTNPLTLNPVRVLLFRMLLQRITIPHSMLLLCFSGVHRCLTHTVWTSCPLRLPEAFANWTSVPHLTGCLVKLHFSLQLYLPKPLKS